MKRSDDQVDPIEEPDEPPCGCHDVEDVAEPRRSRLVHAYRVLIGREVTNAQMAAEWLEYKLIFNDILTRLGAQLARAAKSEKKRIRKAIDAADQVELDVTAAPPAPKRDKSELRRRAAAMRGIRHPLDSDPPIVLHNRLNGGNGP